MSPIAPFVLALATAVGLASPGFAQSEPAPSLPRVQINLADLRTFETGREGELRLPAMEIQPRTSIDHRLSGDSVFGAIGYFCVPEVSSDTMHLAAPNADAKDDRLLGASVRYAF